MFKTRLFSKGSNGLKIGLHLWLYMKRDKFIHYDY